MLIECLPSATNDGRTSRSFHILGNPPFSSSMESGLGREFDQPAPVSPQFHVLDCAAVPAQSPPTAESTSAGCCSWHGIITWQITGAWAKNLQVLLCYFHGPKQFVWQGLSTAVGYSWEYSSLPCSCHENPLKLRSLHMSMNGLMTEMDKRKSCWYTSEWSYYFHQYRVDNNHLHWLQNWPLMGNWWHNTAAGEEEQKCPPTSLWRSSIL